MRPRDVRVYLFDMIGAAEAIQDFIGEKNSDDYLSDRMLRSAVERQFEILGEAMKRALAAEPALADEIAVSRGVVDFRNVIAHEYDFITDNTVWRVATEHLPSLAAELRAALGRRG